MMAFVPKPYETSEARPLTGPQLLGIARYQRWLRVGIVAHIGWAMVTIIAALASEGRASPVLTAMAIIWLTGNVAILGLIVLLTRLLSNTLVSLLVGAMSLLPLFALGAFFLINRAATDKLRGAGYKVGWFGVARALTE